MEFSKSLQENVLTLLCFDTDRAKIISGIVTPTLFDGVYRDIATRALSYIHEFHVPPGVHLSDLFEHELQSSTTQGDHYRDVLMDLHRHKREINAEYTMGKLEEFINIQNLKSGIIEAAELLQQEGEGCVEAVTEVMVKAAKRRADVLQIGTFLSDPRVTTIIKHIAQPAFPIGIPELDRENLGPARKELHVLMALTNRGKSWWLVHLGRQALVNRLKVLHVTLEMNEGRVLERYIQNIFSIPRRVTETMITKFHHDKKHQISKMSLETVKHAFSLQDEEATVQLESRLAKWRPRLRRLLVKEFPTGRLTVPHLESYLDSLECREHFTPDLILIDYADLMHVSTTHRREDIGKIYVDLRGMAMERNIAMATVAQSNREGLKAKGVLSEGNMGEDWSKVQTADVLITFNQTDRERMLGLARLHTNKARTEQVGQTIVISQNYKAGQFCLQSAPMGTYQNILEQYADSVGQV